MRVNLQAQYEVPLNWSPPFLDFICENRSFIWCVYGSIVGEPGGRPIPHSIRLPPAERPDKERLRHVVERLGDAGISFNLVMNSSCYGNRLCTDDGKVWLRGQAETIRELGIEWVTVSNFDLARRLSSLVPQAKILLSVMFNVVSIDAVTYIIKQDFNFRGMVVGKGITKRLPRLQTVVCFLEERGLKAVVMANDFCPTANCPERMSDHNNSCAHYHSHPFDYMSPSIYCRLMAMRDPSHYLQGSYINPNDIPVYESLGVRQFKLTDRVMPDDELIRVCRAYFSRHYCGNLFDLFTYTSYLGHPVPECRHLSDVELARTYLGGYTALKEKRPFFVYKPYLDAQSCSGPGSFFEYFQKGGCTADCGSRLYGVPGCTYCEERAKDLIQYDRDDWNTIRSNIERYIRMAQAQKSLVEEIITAVRTVRGSND